ncbi:nucleopolyhedrovirus P10 family protein [Streptomyces sp. NPDC059785]|uniref:nucleopolyhedrovirus P10 family protein n=1 Tax=Streptomyces sp. NPDC059785 TaxID=3346945 RepID=UPI00364B7B4C
MTADRWTQVVRRQLGLGRLLPLGGARDGAWITEAAAGTVLRHAAELLPGVRPGTLRIALADPDEVREAAVPPPPSALPPGPLRVTAEFTAAADPAAPDSEPLPQTADRLRTALLAAAHQRLGLAVDEVDLRVTDLLNGDPDGDSGPDSPAAPDTGARRPAAGPPAGDGETSRAAAAALSVPGVTRTTDMLGHPVHIQDTGPGDDAALPRRHVRVEIAVTADVRALDAARAVRGAVAAALPDHPSVAVVVTAVDGSL